MIIENITERGLKLKRVYIEPKLPSGLSPLADLAQNLWWSWNHDAIALFKEIDPVAYIELDYNPVALLDALSVEKAEALVQDKQFMARMKAVHVEFIKYINDTPSKNDPLIAYFCMEYGLHQSVRLYSGGLGVLAGDYVKEASDCKTNMIAVGLLYRYGYFQQEISLHGEQINHLDPSKFTKLPLQPVRDAEDEWLKVSISLEGRTVWAKIWKLAVGRVSLFLLDTDIDENRWEDRSLTHQLYGGDNEHRIKQEILLGMGGMRALKAMRLTPDVFHLNEGHAAFLGLERLKNYMQGEGMSYLQALEVVRSTQLFTTHTPVPAGHDAFPESMMRKYLFDLSYELNITWEKLISMGKKDLENASELFSMSLLALRTSQECNGVSRLHGEVSRDMFNNLYPSYHKSELFIGHVTNGVHFPTWVSKEWLDLYKDVLGKKFLTAQSDPKNWEKIYKADDKRIADLRQTLKKRLLDYVKESLQSTMARRGENPRNVFEIVNAIHEDALVIGFARRFATYKRATLLFKNEDRLAELVNNANRPVIFLFAGKAHPADKGGQELIRFIYNTSLNPRFKGKVIFLENYGMEMAKLLTQGVDVWLNNPTRPKEASGTSGMKAVMNGVLNFSVLDGWWCEGYRPDAGWALPEESTYDNDELQNQLDAERIYNILENEIVPTFYDKKDKGYSTAWIERIKNNCAHIAPQFTMKRMLDEYHAKYYGKLATRSAMVHKNDYRAAKDFAEWKMRVSSAWNGIELMQLQAPDTDNHSLPSGTTFEARATLNLHSINPTDIGVEVVFFRRKTENDLDLVACTELKLVYQEQSVCVFACAEKLGFSGVYEYGFRIFPKHTMMAHRQELNLVRWL